jgi:hypothetical protein
MLAAARLYVLYSAVHLIGELYGRQWLCRKWSGLGRRTRAGNHREAERCDGTGHL